MTNVERQWETASPARRAVYRMTPLSASSPPSLAGVASGLPLGFHGGFPRGPLSDFRIAGRLLGFQRGLTSRSLGDLPGGQGSSLTSFNRQLGGYALSDASRAPSRAVRRSTAAGLSAADRARAAGSSRTFFASAAALKQSAKRAFLDQFISIFAQGEAAPVPVGSDRRLASDCKWALG